jgi:hypothetical protein
MNLTEAKPEEEVAAQTSKGKTLEQRMELPASAGTT